MIGDIVSKVIVDLKVDTTDYKKGLREAQGEEKKFADATLKGAEARNASLDKWVKGIGTATVAIGAAAAAGAAMWAGMEHNVRKAQLAANVSAESVERLRRGFGGLRTEMQALEAANSLNNSKMKLSGDQMETVGKAIRQLVREGHDWEEVTKKVTDAFIKLNGGGLDDFGILIENGKTEAETFNRILDAMAAKAGNVGDGTRTTAEEMVALKTKFSDVMDSVKQSLGEIGTAFLPIVEALASIAGYAATLVSMVPGGGGTIGKVAKYGIPVYGQALAIKDGLGALFADKDGLGGGLQGRVQVPDALKLGNQNVSRLGDNNPFMQNSSLASIIGDGASVLRMYAYLAGGEPADFLAKVAGRIKPGRAGKPGKMAGYDLGDTEFASGQGLFAGGNGGYLGDISSGINLPSPAGYSERPGYDFVSEENARRYNAFNAGRTDSKLEGIFGPLSEFDAYKTAFETLNGAVGSAFSAWIDGSASAGEAFKKFIGEALKGVAVQMAMEAIKHGAYAIGNLAFGNFAGAAMHGKAAASFAAGAVLVGAAAKGMHSGGSSGGASSSAPGGGVPSYSGGGQQSGGSQSVVVAFGQDYSMDSSREKQLRAARAFNAAQQSGAIDGAVTWA